MCPIDPAQGAEHTSGGALGDFALAVRARWIRPSYSACDDSHHDDVAKAQAAATGVDIAVKRFVARSSYRVVPVDDEAAKSLTGNCRSLCQLGLIPKPVNVSDIIGKWSPGS